MADDEGKKQLTVVIGAIRNGEGRILLQKRIDPLIPNAHEKWEFPGGRIDFGELPEDALVREVQEEVGCAIAIRRLLPLVQSRVWARADGKEQHVMVLCYEAELIGGTPAPVDAKVSEVGWFARDEIMDMDTLLGIAELVESLEK